MIKYGSRKFIGLILLMGILVALPILYKQYGIGEAITLVVLGGIAGGFSLYLGANVMEKKIK